MDIGINLSNRHAVGLPERGIPYGLSEFVQASIEADAMGFKHVQVAHSLSAKPRWAAVPLMAYLAATTKHAKLGTSILQPNLYNNPLLLAQELITIDHLTQGRFQPGFGLGAGRGDLVEQELATVGVEKKTRGKRFSENLEVLNLLLTEEEVTFHGRFYKLDKVRLGLKPYQKPRPPFWIAAAVIVHHDWNFASANLKDGNVAIGTVPPAAADRVARFGDGWMMDACPLEALRPNLESIRQKASEEYRRDSKKIEAIWGTGLTVAREDELLWKELRFGTEMYHQHVVPDEVIRLWNIFGEANQCVEQLKAWEMAGLDTFIAYVGAGGGKYIGKEPIQQMRDIAENVLPAFHGT